MIGTSVTAASPHVIYDSTSGALFYDPDGSGSIAQIQIGSLLPSLQLTYLGFQII